MDTVDILIIGAGQAGAAAAAALRGHGVTGRIRMVGAEAIEPYERPPLSKALLKDGTISEAFVHAAGFYEKNGIALSLGSHVLSLDTAARVARLSDGSSIRYGQCLIATGGRARQVDGLPANADRVHYLRHAADGARLREALKQHRRLLVVGGGFLGLEVASTARSLGLDVTVVEAGDRLLPRALPSPAAQWLAHRARHAGVDLRMASPCASFESSSQGVAAVLKTGERVEADLCVAAIGQLPDVTLAAAAGLALHPGNGGIRVDARCATSAPGVFAAGDCTSQFHPHAGTEIRLESWQNANEQARLAAAALAGVPAEGLKAPWFWTDQFGVNLQILGLPEPGLGYHLRGAMDAEADTPKFMLFGTTPEGRLAHVIAANAGGDLRAVRGLVDLRTPCRPDVLCDTALPLKRAAIASVSSPTPVLEGTHHA